jgi:hypothetical protein
MPTLCLITEVGNHGFRKTTLHTTKPLEIYHYHVFFLAWTMENALSIEVVFIERELPLLEPGSILFTYLSFHNWKFYFNANRTIHQVGFWFNFCVYFVLEAAILKVAKYCSRSTKISDVLRIYYKKGLEIQTFNWIADNDGRGWTFCDVVGLGGCIHIVITFSICCWSSPGIVNVSPGGHILAVHLTPPPCIISHEAAK